MRIPRGHRVVIVGGLYGGRRGITLTEASGAERIRIRLDQACGRPVLDVWVPIYLLEREDWHDA